MNQHYRFGFPRTIRPRPRAVQRTPFACFIVLVCLVIAGCTTDDAEPTEEVYDPAAGAGDTILPMTITEWMFPPEVSKVDGSPVGLTHLSITPMEPGENTITVELTNMDGAPLPEATGESAPQLSYRTLTPESTTREVDLAPVADHRAMWEAESLELPDQGWYAFEVTLSGQDSIVGTTTIYMLLPDPSVHGTDAPELPETDPEAEELYTRALEAYGSWEAARWRESLGSGTDVVVVTDYTVTNRPSQPPASLTESLYSGAFRTREDGTEPAPPRHDFATRIAIGDQGWTRLENESWEAIPTLGVSTFEERADIYTGATNIRMGETATINGTETQIITFYLPPKGGQSEAWFAWWVDPDTGNPVRMAMVARMHFMVWDFADVNGSFTIAPPPGFEDATPTDN